MRRLVFAGALALLALAVPTGPAGAVTVPYTEGFASNDSGWRGNLNSIGTLDWNAGGYVTEVFNFAGNTADQTLILLRGPVSASGGNFAGDWVLNGVSQINALVRHDAPVGVTFFARLARPAGSAGDGFPGAVIVEMTTPVAVGSGFSAISFDIFDGNPLFTYEGGPNPLNFSTVFGNIATVQFGVYVPAELAGSATNYDFDMTSVSLVPEASGLSALALASCAALGALRTRKRSF
jgi:hypothetical protein